MTDPIKTVDVALRKNAELDATHGLHEGGKLYDEWAKVKALALLGQEAIRVLAGSPPLVAAERIADAAAFLCEVALDERPGKPWIYGLPSWLVETETEKADG